MDKSEDIDKRFDNIDSQLDKIASAVTKGFNDIDKALETKASKDDMQRVLDLIDAFAKRLEISEQERLVMGHQIDRLDGWVHALAKKNWIRYNRLTLNKSSELGLDAQPSISGIICYYIAINIMNILITGTSGSGKSAVAQTLKKRGFDVIETDKDIFNGLSIAYWRSKSTRKGIDMPWPPPENWRQENDWVWRIDILGQRLASNPNSTVFACGDSRNKEEAYSLFDKIFILKANDATLHQRLQSRVDNYFGKSPSEYAWILEENRSIAESARKAGGIVIDANQTLEKVVDDILAKLG